MELDDLQRVKSDGSEEETQKETEEEIETEETAPLLKEYIYKEKTKTVVINIRLVADKLGINLDAIEQLQLQEQDLVQERS